MGQLVRLNFAVKYPLRRNARIISYHGSTPGNFFHCSVDSLRKGMDGRLLRMILNPEEGADRLIFAGVMDRRNNSAGFYVELADLFQHVRRPGGSKGNNEQPLVAFWSRIKNQYPLLVRIAS